MAHHRRRALDRGRWYVIDGAMNTSTRALLRTELSDVGLRTLVRGIVRRRVPAADVEDVVQATFCDALAAGAHRVPASATDVRRWLVRIATNKAVDHFRRRRREVAHDGDDRVDELSGASADPDSRILVARAVECLGADPAAQQTLDLALREADGESYAELARGQGSSEAALRQRVSRFRRQMSSRWLVAAALAALVVTSWGALRRERSAAAIRDDVDPMLAGESSGNAGSLGGRWRVVSWAGKDSLRVAPPALTLEVHAHTVRLAWLGGEHALTVLRASELAGGGQEWQLAGPSVTAQVTPLQTASGMAATLVIADGPWAGTAVVQRSD